MIAPAPCFDQLGPSTPHSPIVLSVPHAGRDYPDAMLSALRAPLAALRVLEDRHVDAVARAAQGRETLFIQRTARAWIDLNRAEQERDPKLDDGADMRTQATASAKLRSGLGLVPRRVAGAGDIWRKRLTDADVMSRIEQAHRPYHRALGAALNAARARFGVAVLLDIHSMPPLLMPEPVPRIVLGDRFGQSAADRFVSRLQVEIDAARLPHALNTPYAGGHILARHAAPARGVHAIQIEFDRRLYLDAVLAAPGPGLAFIAALLRQMIDSLADEALAGRLAAAAE
ncbi:MAG: N-formylglutamate amidohydrolase [Sphingomonas sp.]